MKKISLIISTYNRPDALDLVLYSVIQQQLNGILNPSDVEVIIADDGSETSTKSIVDKYKLISPFEILHVWHEDNGFRLATIRNLAVSKSHGEYIIFIDGDCIIPLDYITNQYLLAEKNYFVGGNRILLSESYTKNILDLHDISIVDANIFESIFARLKRHTNKIFHALRFGLNANWRYNNKNNWRRPKGCNMAVWRESLYKVNGFDESFTGWGHEDADFLIRLLHAGITIKDGRFAVPVYHLWHKMSDRSKEDDNARILLARLEDEKFIYAINGLDKY